MGYNEYDFSIQKKGSSMLFKIIKLASLGRRLCRHFLYGVTCITFDIPSDPSVPTVQPVPSNLQKTCISRQLLYQPRFARPAASPPNLLASLRSAGGFAAEFTSLASLVRRLRRRQPRFARSAASPPNLLASLRSAGGFAAVKEIPIFLIKKNPFFLSNKIPIFLD